MNMDRREFVKLTGGLVAAVVVPGCASVAAIPVQPVDGAVRLSLAEFPALAAPGGHVRIRPAGGEPIIVIAQDDGGFAALSPKCTHRGCTVNVEPERIACPCHGSVYDRTGEVLRGPAERPLARYALNREANGDLVITLRDLP